MLVEGTSSCNLGRRFRGVHNYHGKNRWKAINRDTQANQHDEELLINTGKAIRELHRNAVNHGDLSTNNILITNEGEVVLIDLGLSSREYDIEGFGIDLHVLHEILRASHPDVKGAMDLVLKGYVALDEELGKPEIAPGGMPPDAVDVVKRLNQIMMRVRYHGG